MHGYNIDLDTRIQAAIEEFRDARDAVYSEVEGGEKAVATAGQIASVVLEVSSSLVVKGGFDFQEAWNWVRDVITRDGGVDIVTEELRMSLASELLPDTEQMALRCISVTREVMFREPNESVRRFLRRLTRCYIAGFMPECVMLCRSVVENAVTEVMTALRLTAKPNRDGHVGMGARLDELLRVGRLRDESHKAAREVWKRGNKAVHHDPLLVKEVTETVDMTVRVLLDLYRSPLPSVDPA